jgi:hypothetical protein
MVSERLATDPHTALCAGALGTGSGSRPDQCRCDAYGEKKHSKILIILIEKNKKIDTKYNTRN